MCFVRTLSGFLSIALLSLAAEDQLSRHRNLGKAFYENPTTQVQAVDEFRKAMALAPKSARDRLNYGLALLRAGKTTEGIAELEAVQKQDPKIPHTWFNLGIQYKKQGQAEAAVAQFEQMVKLVPDDPISQYNLGASYKLAGRAAEALKHFEIAAKLDPNLAGPHFQLFNAYRAAGRPADAKRELAAFQKIKKETEGAAIPEDMEWNMFAEVLDEVEPAPPAPAPKYAVSTIPGNGAAILGSELLVWSASGLRIEGKGTIVSGPVTSAAVGDFDNDGFSDLAVMQPAGVTLYRNVKGKFVAQASAIATGAFHSAVWIDYDHDYDLDLVLLGSTSKLFRNQGTAGFADRTADFPFQEGEALAGVVFRLVPDTKGFDLVVSYTDRAVLYRDKLAGTYKAEKFSGAPAGARNLYAVDTNQDGVFEITADLHADVDGDHDTDVIATSGGTLEKRLNQNTPATWVSVQLNGIKNLKLAKHAEVEVKSGGLYMKKLYEESPLSFDLRGNKQIDAIRITWPNGLIQNEIQQAAGKAYKFDEAQRLSGSCPMIWTWNGREFVYITDVLGVAPLGASSGDGSFFPVDSDEYIQISRDALAPRDGVYEIRVTEELSEVAYLDKVSLIAVDHPADVEIFTNDKFKAPPFPDFRLFGVSRRYPPVTARQNEANVLDAVLRRDRVYPENFRRELNGVADRWSLELDFGPEAARANKAILVLSGWVDWADGSTFLAKAQEGSGGLITPYLQVRNERGEWETVIEDMGMPAGKPKTIVVDVTGKFRSSSREVRIVTNLAVYWDEIFLSEDTGAPAVTLTPMQPEGDLRFRGFSRVIVHPERRQPEMFLYPDPSPYSMWNQTPGMYTRYGSVGQVLNEGDDRFVIMGSGDELRLRFDASKLPPLPAGHVRDFLLHVEGWAKDRDPNTAFSQTVAPLPFRHMSAYPYPSTERYPLSPDLYDRPALRPMRPLRSRQPQ